jgi:uncharacterized protein (DUF4415 family)
MPARKPVLGTDLAKVDAHVITPEEYDENPEWTKEDFVRATLKIGDRIVGENEFRKAWKKAMGRPKSENPKQAVSLRLDSDVVEHYKAGGRGWQTRINATLRRAAHLTASKKAAALKPGTKAKPSKAAASRPRAPGKKRAKRG